jgi:arsenite methyltransferase
MVAVLGFSKEQIRAAVSSMYTQVATAPDSDFHFPTGRRGCKVIGYQDELLEGVPDSAIESFAGVACPFTANLIGIGDTVLDIGSGSGTDAMIAAKLVGEHGRVLALDSTDAMRRKLAETLAKEGIARIEILDGDAENIPLADASVDVVTSNGVLNLVPDKRRAVNEMFRVLRPGGHAQIADVVIKAPVTPDCKQDPALWAECVVGASVDEVYLQLYRDAGFTDVEVIQHDDYFAHSPSAETREVASRFGGHAIVMRMRRAMKAPTTIARIARRMDPRRIAAAIRRRGLYGIIALVVALLACYGTLALTALLSVLGISLMVDEGIWAGAVALLSVIAFLVVAAGQRSHGSFAPAAPAFVGAALIVYTMLVNYHFVTELVGFILLAIGAAFDFWKRWTRSPLHHRR